MTTQESINKFLTELKVDGELVFPELGGCYHKISYARGSYSHPYCEKCDETDSLNYVVDIHTWEGFGILWEGMQKRKELATFIRMVEKMFCIQTDCSVFPMYHINPLTFPRLLVGFFGGLND